MAGAIGKKIVAWRSDLDRIWATLRFGKLRVESRNELHRFEVEVHIGESDLYAVRVELYADGLDGGTPVRLAMECMHKPPGAPSGCYLFETAIDAARPHTDYTPRVISDYAGVAIPLEEPRILWRRQSA